MKEAKENFTHAQRPFEGFDIDEWRNARGLSMNDATYVLGLASYKKVLETKGMIPYALELLMRLYDENPCHGVWPTDRMTLGQLFNDMYSKDLQVFEGTGHETAARVDLRGRFAKLLGRSQARVYHWLDNSEVDASINNRTQEAIQGILGKLSQLKNPGATLERLGGFIWALRGDDVDLMHPIPTLRHPPRRERRGRRPKSKLQMEGSVRRVIAPGTDIKVKEIVHAPKAATVAKTPKPAVAAKSPKAPKAPKAIKTFKAAPTKRTAKKVVKGAKNG